MGKVRVKNQAGTRAWNKLVEPFCVHAKENRGFQSRVAEKMSADFKLKIAAPQVQQWLAPNPKVRVEPRAGIAAILLQVCNELVG